MASTYVNDLRLNELGTGDGSGTWGTTTNTNLELIAEGLSFGTEGITTNADTHTSTVADGSTDPARSMFIKYTGTLDSACTITIAPNTISRVHFIENGTSGSQNIIIKQGSGATVTIAPGDVKVVYLDGAGSGAAVVDAFASLSVAVLNATDGCTITTADNTTQLTLTSTDADASVGPRFDLKRDSGSPADSDNLGRMRYLFNNDAAEQTEGVRVDAVLTDASDGTEDVSYVIDTMIAGTLRERIGLDATETVFNEDSQDIDFRIESNANANCFFVNAGTSNVGINGAPAHELDVLANDTDGDATLRVKAGTNSASVATMNITTAATAGDRESRLAFGDASNANIGKIAYHHDDESMRFSTNAAERMRLEGTTMTMFDGASKLLFKREDTTTIAGNPLGAVEFSHTDSTDAGTASKILGEGDGSSGEGRIAFYTGTPSALTESMRIGSNGNVGIGTTATTFQLDVRGNVAANYLAYFFNDGNNANRYGVLIQAGADSGSGTLIGFYDGNGTGIGGITFSGGTVTYGAFTAQHPCIIPDADNNPDSDSPAYPYGTLLETTSLSYTKKSDGTDSERGIMYNVRKTQTANSKAVLGAYGRCMNGGPEHQTNEHQALVLGDGHILCNNSGGNIEMGDGICSSAAAGIGQKATANPSMIIGIAQEAVTFSSDTETKLVAVQYGLQQFIPWS